MSPDEKQEQTETLLSHYREAVTAYGQRVLVPVIDVRDGPAQRAMATQMIKAGNRSLYMNYSHYQLSPKEQKQPL